MNQHRTLLAPVCAVGLVAFVLLALPLLVAGCCYFPAAAPRSGSPPPSGGIAPNPYPPPAGGTCHFTIAASFPMNKPSGLGWDVGGGAPDPYVIIRQDGREIARTAQQQDSFTVSFVLDAVCDHARPITIDLIDRDLSSDDSGGTFTIDPGAAYSTPSTSGGVDATITVERR